MPLIPTVLGGVFGVSTTLVVNIIQRVPLCTKNIFNFSFKLI
jgi:hypothetical protein